MHEAQDAGWHKGSKVRALQGQRWPLLGHTELEENCSRYHAKPVLGLSTVTVGHGVMALSCGTWDKHSQRIV